MPESAAMGEAVLRNGQAKLAISEPAQFGDQTRGLGSIEPPPGEIADIG